MESQERKAQGGGGEGTVGSATIVVAVSRDGVIGVVDEKSPHGRLPWRIRSDLKHFKAITDGQVVVMGRKTFESLASEGAPGGLPNRLNIVVSRTMGAGEVGPGSRALVAGSLEEAVRIARREAPDRRVCVIGGAALFEEAIRARVADVIEITDVQAEIESKPGQRLVMFPDEPVWSNDPAKRAALGWKLECERATERDEAKGDQYACVFRRYRRTSAGAAEGKGAAGR